MLAHLSSEGSLPLFDRAIVQSPCVDHFWSPEKSREVAELYLKTVGAKSPEELLSMPYGKIGKANGKLLRKLIVSGEITCPFSPTVDGEFLKDFPGKIAGLSGPDRLYH